MAVWAEVAFRLVRVWGGEHEHGSDGLLNAVTGDQTAIAYRFQIGVGGLLAKIDGLGTSVVETAPFDRVYRRRRRAFDLNRGTGF